MQTPTNSPNHLCWSVSLLNELKRTLSVIGSNRYNGTIISLAPPTFIDPISAIIALISINIKGNVIVVSQKNDSHQKLAKSISHWMDEREIKGIIELGHDNTSSYRKSILKKSDGKIIIVPPLILESDIRLSNCHLGREDFLVFIEPMLPSTATNWTPLLRKLFVAKNNFDGGFIIFSYLENIVHLPFPLKWPRITKYLGFDDVEKFDNPTIHPIDENCELEMDTLIISDDIEIRNRYISRCSTFENGRRKEGSCMFCSPKELQSENWDSQGTRIPLNFFNQFKHAFLFLDPLKKENQSLVSILGKFPKIAIHCRDTAFYESFKADRSFCLHKIEKWTQHLPIPIGRDGDVMEVLEREFRFSNIKDKDSMTSFNGVDEMVKELKFNLPPLIPLTILPSQFMQGNQIRKSSISLMLEEFIYLFPPPQPSPLRKIRLEMLKYMEEFKTANHPPIKMINELINKINN